MSAKRNGVKTNATDEDVTGTCGGEAMAHVQFMGGGQGGGLGNGLRSNPGNQEYIRFLEVRIEQEEAYNKRMVAFYEAKVKRLSITFFVLSFIFLSVASYFYNKC